jgi:phospholipid/cholesterol/gamma-HCH transport system substrate-binding protein
MNRRILTNLAFFAALGLTLVIWALTSLVSIDTLRRPVSVTADFTSSPGLRRDLEVAYLGVRVGSVGDVRLRPGRVAVQLKLDKGTTVPADARAAVLRKSAIGEPYVELSPPSGPGGRPLRAGDHIPLSRTSVTVEYKRVFDSAGPLVRSIPPTETGTLTRELANGLEGRGTTLRDLIGDAHQLTGTLSANAATLDSLAVQLTRLTGTLAGSGPQLGSGVNDLAAFTAALRDSRKDIDGILNHGPGLVEQVNGLLDDSRRGMRCTLYALGAPGPPVFTPATTAKLRHALEVLGSGNSGLVSFADSITRKTPKGNFIRIKPVVSLPGAAPAARQYPRPTPAPVLPPLFECAGDGRTARDLPAATASPGTQGTRPGAAHGPFVTADPRGAETPPAASPWSRWPPMVLVSAAALVLAYAVYRLGATVRRHRRIS